jgi:hypothetical protein
LDDGLEMLHPNEIKPWMMAMIWRNAGTGRTSRTGRTGRTGQNKGRTQKQGRHIIAGQITSDSGEYYAYMPHVFNAK